MKKPFIITYIKVLNFIFWSVILLMSLLVLFCEFSYCDKNKSNFFVYIGSVCIISFVEIIVYSYYMKTSYDFFIFNNEDIQFLQGKGVQVRKIKKCVSIREKNSLYVFLFDGEHKIVLRKAYSFCKGKYIKNEKINHINFPYSVIDESS